MIMNGQPDTFPRGSGAKGEHVTVDAGLRRLALRTLLAAFRGDTAPEWATDLLADGLAGYTLFGYNIVDRPQLAALTARLHDARPGVRADW